jgi:putative spermidine/putrescine transport system substrate-binding protein
VRPSPSLRRSSLVAFAFVALAACGRGDKDDGTPTAAAGATAAAPKLEGELELLTLPGRAERGKTDPAYDWLSAFERGTGCKVRTSVAESPAALLDRLSAPGVDVAIVPSEIVLTLVASGDIRPIDTARVPLLAKVHPRLADGAWARVDGERYAVPFVWRPQVLRYRPDVFRTPPGDAALYAVARLPDGRPNTARVQVADTPMAIADAALYLAHTRPELGIDDPYALDPRQYAAALALVRVQAALVNRWWSDPQAQAQEFAAGGTVLATSWPAAPRFAPAANDASAWIAPEGDVAAQAEGAVLAVKSAHPNCADAWLAWSLEPPVQEAAAAWLGAVPANTQACARPLLAPDLCERHGVALLERAHVRRPAQAACARSGGCVPYSRWTQDFHALRGD